MNTSPEPYQVPESVEGVDYIINLYAALDIPSEAETSEINSLLKQRSREYHPDRLEGVAPEFKAKGERMARLLSDARGILLDTDKRAHYDRLLSEWDGLVSTTGDPVMTPELWQRKKLLAKSPDEIEAAFQDDRKDIAAKLNFSEGTFTMLTRMVEGSDGDVPDDVRNAYEDALLSYDRLLAIDEAQRGDLLGLPDLNQRGYAVLEGYSEVKESEIEVARTTIREEAVLRAIGGVGTIKQLESGSYVSLDPLSEEGILERVAATALPEFFEGQAEKLVEIAKERESILEKRLKNYRLTYPHPEQQATPQPLLALVLETDSATRFVGLTYNLEEVSCNNVRLSNEVVDALRAGEYRTVIEQGYSVVVAPLLDQVDEHVFLNTIAEKHWENLEAAADVENV